MKNEAGNALLEMVMFAPLALLLLFGATDAGLYFMERASVQDAVRAGTTIELQVSRSKSVLTVTQSAEVKLNEERVTKLLQETASEIANNIALSHISNTKSRYRVRVAGVLLDVDPTTGSVTSYSLRGPITVSHLDNKPDDSTPTSKNLPLDVESYPLPDIDSFIQKELENGPKSVSFFAIPVVKPQDLDSSNSPRFLSKSFAVYAEAASVPHGLGSRFLRSALGRNYWTEYQYLGLPRMPLR